MRVLVSSHPWLRRTGLVLAMAAIGCFSLLEIAEWQMHASSDEAARPLPGDGLIVDPVGSVNHAITLPGSPKQVWRWIAQMGAGRAGWYSYDFIDNGGRPSARRILAEYQGVRVGDIMPAVPGAVDAFEIVEVNWERALVLAWRRPDGVCQSTWTFHLEELKAGETRLVVRGRAAHGYRPLGFPEWLAVPLARGAHLVMERRQLLGIAERVRSENRAEHSAPKSSRLP